MLVFRYILPLVIMCVLLLSCQHTVSKRGSLSRPEMVSLDSTVDHPDIKQLVFVATNDFHGGLDPFKESITDKKGKTFNYLVGGASIMARYFEILEERYPAKVMKLDIGDAFTGSPVSKMFKGEPVIQFFNALKYDAATLGNHDFDFNTAFTTPHSDLKKLMALAKFPFINDNLRDSSNHLPKWPNLYPYMIKEINGIKVGLIGLLTEETPKLTLKERIIGLNFLPYKKQILSTSSLLKQQGAEVIVLMVHDGIHCDENKEDFSLGFEKRFSDSCNNKATLPQILQDLPPKTVDVVFSGHSHTLMAYDFHGMPLMQAKDQGRYISTVEIFYDKKQKKLLTDKTIIHPPTKLCSSFFNTTHDCFQKSVDVIDRLIPATFLGKTIYPLEKIDNILAPYRKNIEKQRTTIVFTTGRDLNILKHEESELGQLMAKAIKEKVAADVGLVNAEAIRTSLKSGPITYADLNRAIPFDDMVMLITVTGKELKQLAHIGLSKAASGFGCFSGIKGPSSKDPALFPDFTLQHSGETIKDNKLYKLATISFLGEAGGDYYGVVFNKIPQSRKKKEAFLFRDVAIEYLASLAKNNPSYFK